MTNTMTDLDLLAIVALLPIAAVMTLLQKDPYHALVVRGILGAIAALVYALLGAADVALTEALVGTMLAITLYVVAVRSSLVLRLGVLTELADLPEASGLFTQSESSEPRATPPIFIRSSNNSVSDSISDEFSPIREAIVSSLPEPLIAELRVFCRQHFLRLELVPYPDRAALHAALETRDVHAIGIEAESESLPPLPDNTASTSCPNPRPYALTVRVPRLYDLMQAELNPAIVTPLPTFAAEPSSISSASNP